MQYYDERLSEYNKGNEKRDGEYKPRNIRE